MKKNLDDLKPGESYVYHTGLTLAVIDSEEKHTAWRLYYEGKAELTQRRTKVVQKIGGKEYLADGFDYIVTRRRVDVTGKELQRRQQYYGHLEAEKIKQQKQRSA